MLPMKRPIASLPQQQRLDDPALRTVFSLGAARVLPKLRAAGVGEEDMPEEDGSQLDTEKAQLAARLSSIAYCSRPELLVAWNCSRCLAMPDFEMEHVVYDPVWDLVGYVGFYRPWASVVVSFRGTDSSNWGNWAENMRSWRTDKMYPIPDFPKAPHALIHAGFYLLWSASEMEPQMTSAVGDLMQRHPGAPLVAIGHSMGGALAQLAALELKFTFNISYVSVYTFGSPRVGNDAYADLFKSYVDESWRFTHNRDVVPSVPLQLMGFHHVSREVWAVDVEAPSGATAPGDEPQEKLLLCDESGEDPSCHNSACYLGLCTSVADHLVYLGIHMYQDSDEC